VVESYENRMQRSGAEALRAAGRFFKRDDDVHTTLRRVTGRLDELGIPHAVEGGMALVAVRHARGELELDQVLEGEEAHAVDGDSNGRRLGARVLPCAGELAPPWTRGDGTAPAP
jgi:hypothetical protein